MQRANPSPEKKFEPAQCALPPTTMMSADKKSNDIPRLKGDALALAQNLEKLHSTHIKAIEKYMEDWQLPSRSDRRFKYFHSLIKSIQHGDWINGLRNLAFLR